MMKKIFISILLFLIPFTCFAPWSAICESQEEQDATTQASPEQHQQSETSEVIEAEVVIIPLDIKAKAEIWKTSKDTKERMTAALYILASFVKTETEAIFLLGEPDKVEESDGSKHLSWQVDENNWVGWDVKVTAEEGRR